MKLAKICSSLGLVAIVTSIPVHSEIFYEGSAKIVKQSAECRVPFGEMTKASYHPGSLTFPKNIINDYIATFYFPTVSGGATWKFSADTDANQYMKATVTQFGWFGIDVPRTSYIKLLKMTPKNLTSATGAISTYISIDGEFKNPLGLPGQENCVATVNMVGLRSIYTPIQ